MEGLYPKFNTWRALKAVAALSLLLTIINPTQSLGLRHSSLGAPAEAPAAIIGAPGQALGEAPAAALLQSEWGIVPYTLVRGNQTPQGSLEFYFDNFYESNEAENENIEGAEASACPASGWRYGGAPFAVVEGIDSASSCQQQCQQSSACEAFAFDTSSNKCELHFAIAEKNKQKNKAFISGPRYCAQCHNTNGGDDGEGGVVVISDAAEGVHSADECQLRCQATPKCEYWSFSSGGCKLLAGNSSSSSSSSSSSGIGGGISGPKYCEGSCDILGHQAPRKKIGYNAQLYNKSLSECREACRGTKRCSSFTSWTNGDCYLKEAITLRSLEPRDLATTGTPSCSTCFHEGAAYTPESANLLWTLPAENPEECRGRCDLMERCTYFTYNANNKTCFMLSGKTGEELNEQFVSGPARCTPNTSCYVHDVKFEGGENIKETAAASAAECQALCAEHPQCNFFSFNGSVCYMKGGEAGVRSTAAEGWVSGNKKCATAEELCYENKMNYPSTDIIENKVTVKDVDGCRDACYKEPACRVWTYEYQNKRCRLRTIEAFGGRTTNSYMLSGGRMGCARCLREGIAYTGELIKTINDLPTETQCQLACEADTSCNYFTFISDGINKECRLMQSMGTPQTADMHTTMSGPKRC